jgi:3'-phosphoadenosine 5'-phosphosulfate sulfotransferase (PAPS reductase)/FAD synthetase
MIYDNIKLLSEKIQEKQDSERLFMSFSTGADSIAMFLRCLESGIWDMEKGIFYYMYHVPGITWVDEYINWFENKFNVKIYQVPGPILLADLTNGLYQTPSRKSAFAELMKTGKSFVPMKRDDIEWSIRQYFGYENAYCAVGVKSGDSAMRRLAMRKTQGCNDNQKKWYPIWDFENRDVIDIIKKHGCKVPYDYSLFGITYENIDYRFSKVIKEKCPNNWATILELFPMAESIISRVEYYHPEYDAKKGVKFNKFGDLVLQPQKPL